MRQTNWIEITKNYGDSNGNPGVFETSSGKDHHQYAIRVLIDLKIVYGDHLAFPQN